MSTQTSPLQVSQHQANLSHPNHLPPPPYHHPISQSTPVTAHSTPLHALLTPAPTFTDPQAFSHLDIDVKLENLISGGGGGGSASSSSTTTSATPVELGPPLSELSQPGLASSSSSTQLTTPGSAKGKNGATGPAEGKSKPHLCHICQRGFTTGGHLQRHQRIHTGVKAFRCPFPGCETRTSRQDNLQQHYRTHLSPSLRRGDGSQARAAVNAAMEAAGIKSTTTRAPRKSKTSNGGTTPSSNSATGSSIGHLPSPYQTPTSSGPTPYVPYMYDPLQHPYIGYPLPPPPLPMMHSTQSASSSRVPSPVNGHTANHNHTAMPLMPTPPHHQPQFYPQPFPPYGYPTAMHQMYRPFPGIPNPYIQPHPHAMYSPGPQHGHQMYSPMQPTFPGHSREGSFSGMMTPGYPGQIPNPMANGNGYPPRTQTSTPISQANDEPSGKGAIAADLSMSVYGRPNTQRPLSPSSTLNGSTGPGSGTGSVTGQERGSAPGPEPGSASGPGPGHRTRRTPPPITPISVPQGVVDPNSMKPPTPHQIQAHTQPPHPQLSHPAHLASGPPSAPHRHPNAHGYDDGPLAGSPLTSLQPSAFHFHSPHNHPPPHGTAINGSNLPGTGAQRSHTHPGYGYTTPQYTTQPHQQSHPWLGRSAGSVLGARASISSQSDGSGPGDGSQKG